MGSIRKNLGSGRKPLVSRVVLILLSLFLGFMASLVDAIRIHQCLLISWRCLWYTLMTACLFLVFTFLGERLIAWFATEPKKTRTQKYVYSFRSTVIGNSFC